MNTKWWKSKHRYTYFIIAIKNFTTPQRVAAIAHGSAFDRSKKITGELIKRGVLIKE
jgi:hypothetical protein